MLQGFTGFTSAHLDFKDATPIKKAYVIASSYRCGSHHLAVRLWETGVLGAPVEYFNYDIDKRFMYARLAATSHGDYYRKLMACRTSKNGVFGVKTHFRHFADAIKQYPPLLEVVSPVTFIYINRKDKIAQAVSMARALQSNAWISFRKRHNPPLFYSTEFIEECLKEIQQQIADWRKWFEQTRIEPFTVHYEDLLADKEAVVEAVIKRLGVENDPREPVVELPQPIKQADDISAKWIQRFKEESAMSTALA